MHYQKMKLQANETMHYKQMKLTKQERTHWETTQSHGHSYEVAWALQTMLDQWGNDDVNGSDR